MICWKIILFVPLCFWGIKSSGLKDGNNQNWDENQTIKDSFEIDIFYYMSYFVHKIKSIMGATL